MGVPFDLLSSTREQTEGSGGPRASSDSLFWSTTAFDTMPAFLSAQLRSVRLNSRPHQSYFVYEGNASILEARTCHMRVDTSELLDRLSPLETSDDFPTSSLDVLFFCSRWCCEPDCCQIKASIWLIAFFSLCSIVLYAIYWCADDYRRRELMRRIFKNYRPVRRAGALRQKRSNAGVTRPRWKETPRISIDPPTPSMDPSITIAAEREGGLETPSFSFAENDVIL